LIEGIVKETATTCALLQASIVADLGRLDGTDVVMCRLLAAVIALFMESIMVILRVVGVTCVVDEAMITASAARPGVDGVLLPPLEKTRHCLLQALNSSSGTILSDKETSKVRSTNFWICIGSFS
jgi:hypothetical protein